MRGRGLGMHFCRVLTERKITERQLKSFWGTPQGIFLSGAPKCPFSARPYFPSSSFIHQNMEKR